MGNFLCYGYYASGDEHDPRTFLFPRGAIFDRDLSTVHLVEAGKVTEFVNHSWYEYSGGDAMALHSRAHDLCFIARSVNFPVQHEPVVVSA